MDIRESSAPARLPALTGVRGVAALWVVAFHLQSNLGATLGIKLDLPVLRVGYLGVDVFFILSGFILCHVYHDAFRRYTVREHLHFLLIRLARIYPLHGFALICVVLVVMAVPGFAERYDAFFFAPTGFVLSGLLLQNFWSHPIVWNGPSWSLSAEWVAYVAFPLPFLLTRRIAQRWQAVTLAALSLLVLALVFFASHREMNLAGRAGFLRLACEFTAGCLIQRAYQLRPHDGASWSRANLIALVVLAACLLYPPAVPFSVLAFGFLIMSLAHHEGWLNRSLSTKTAVFLGEISYSLYLMHFIVMQMEGWYIGRFPPHGTALKMALSAGLVAAILAVSICTWMWVERPARSIGRTLADRLVPQPPAATMIKAVQQEDARLSSRQAPEAAIPAD